MKKTEFIEKHLGTNYTDATEREKTIIRTAFDLGWSFAKKEEPKKPKCDHYEWTARSGLRVCVECGEPLSTNGA